MLCAAEALTQRAEAEGQMEQAVEMLDEASEHIFRANILFDAAGASLDQANAAVEDILPIDVAAGPKALLGSARSRVREATITLRDLPNNHERVQSLTAWRDELRQRIDDLKGRFDSVSAGTEPGSSQGS